MVYVWASSEEASSTTVVWPGSHREVYQELMADPKMIAQGRCGNHFCLLSALDDPSLHNRFVEKARRLPVPAGALLLWNSRTVHQGWSGGPRLAQPVCWEPAERCTPSARERKLRLAALGLPSTHWAALAEPHYLVPSEFHPVTEGCEDKVGKGDGVTLPLRSTLRPVPLLTDATFDPNSNELRRQLTQWSTPLPPEVADMVRSSIDPVFRAIL